MDNKLQKQVFTTALALALSSLFSACIISHVTYNHSDNTQKLDCLSEAK